MSHVSRLQLAISPALLGSVLVIIGFFLPVTMASVVFPPDPPTFYSHSYWNMLADTITGGARVDFFMYLAIVSFLLSILVPLWISSAVVLGYGKPSWLFFSLGFTILGLLEHWFMSSLLVGFNFRSHGIETSTAGPGIGVMYGGFLLCIVGSLIALYEVHRLQRAAVRTPVRQHITQRDM